MAKINLQATFLDENDKLVPKIIEFSLPNGQKIDKEDGFFTLGDALIQCISAQYRDEQEMSMEDKYKRYELYKYLKQSKKSEIELSAEQIVELKKLACKRFPGVVIYGQIEDYLRI